MFTNLPRPHNRCDHETRDIPANNRGEHPTN